MLPRLITCFVLSWNTQILDLSSVIIFMIYLFLFLFLFISFYDLFIIFLFHFYCYIALTQILGFGKIMLKPVWKNMINWRRTSQIKKNHRFKILLYFKENSKFIIDKYKNFVWVCKEYRTKRYYSTKYKENSKIYR